MDTIAPQLQANDIRPQHGSTNPAPVVPRPRAEARLPIGSTDGIKCENCVNARVQRRMLCYCAEGHWQNVPLEEVFFLGGECKQYEEM